MFSGKLSFSNINSFLKTLNKVFIVCSILLVVYILIKFFMIRQDLSTLELDTPSNAAGQSTEKLIPSTLNFSDLSSSISGKDIFKLPKEKKAIVIKPIETETPSSNITKNIKVTGLMLTNNPKVIIEKQNTHETLVLSIGDKIDTLTLKDIQKNKLIFDNQGQNIELAI